jgi:2-polyprenyl-6-methoxyphenol hydroxylase-like FAD-dependent oxidoreductase
LLTGLEGNVFFEKDLEHYTVHEDKVTVSFSDGTTEDGVLLVGADGVRSCVRRQHIPNFKGLDTGMRIIFGKTPLTPEFLAKLPEEYRDGMSLVTNEDDNSQPVLMFESIQFPHAEEVSTLNMPDPYMYWVLVVHRSKIPSSDQDSWHLSSSEAANLANQLTSSWNPHIRTIFEMSDINQTSIRSILSAGPEIDPWRPSSRVTLLGDAAHVMPPTGAMGANTALRDAADLAQRIVSVGGVQNVDEAIVGSYEVGLRDFAKTAIELSWRGGLKRFGLKPAEECEPISM